MATSPRRTRSAAGKNTEATKSKRQASSASNHAQQANPLPQFVYIVIIEDSFSNPDGSDIHAVYSTLEDANNAVKAYASEEYSAVEEFERGFKKDGSAYWSSPDTGEGDRAEIYVSKMKLKRPGSEPKREWDEDEDGNGDEESTGLEEDGDD